MALWLRMACYHCRSQVGARYGLCDECHNRLYRIEESAEANQRKAAAKSWHKCLASERGWSTSWKTWPYFADIGAEYGLLREHTHTLIVGYGLATHEKRGSYVVNPSEFRALMECLGIEKGGRYPEAPEITYRRRHRVQDALDYLDVQW